GTEPVDVQGESVGPRSLFIACAEPRLRRPEGRDLVALRVEVEGEKEGRQRRIVYDLLDDYDEETGISAMERTTGVSLAITGVMEMAGRSAEHGVFTADQGVPAEEWMRELDWRGVRNKERDD